MTSTPSRLELARFLVQELGEGHRHVGAAAVVGVGDGVADGHRARQRELEPALGIGAREAHLLAMDRAAPSEPGGDRGHVHDVAVVADAHLGLARPIDALDLLEEAVHEMHPELLAVGDDVDAGRFLLLQPHQRGVALGALEFGAVLPPCRPELFGLGEPWRFRQTAGDGGFQHGASSSQTATLAWIMRAAPGQSKPARGRCAPPGTIAADESSGPGMRRLPWSSSAPSFEVRGLR